MFGSPLATPMADGQLLWLSINRGQASGKVPIIYSLWTTAHWRNVLLILFADILDELGDQFHEDEDKIGAGDQLFVKFFDDEDFELVPVNGLNKIESYSCKSKKKYIRSLSSHLH